MPQSKEDYDYTLRQYMVRYARMFIGQPYVWGGKGFGGVDCSGLVVECLKGIGVLPEKFDDTADGLWRRYQTHEEPDPKTGYLAFWFNLSGKATHVAICDNPLFCITADNGGSEITTPEEAHAVNAYVKMRHILHRKSKPCFVNPVS